MGLKHFYSSLNKTIPKSHVIIHLECASNRNLMWELINNSFQICIFEYEFLLLLLKERRSYTECSNDEN